MGNTNPAPRTLLEALVLSAQPIEVELASVLLDGKPARIRMMCPPPLEWSKRGRSFPIATGKKVINLVEDPGGEEQAMEEWHEYGREMLKVAIYEAEFPLQNFEDQWYREWRSVKLVDSDATPQPPYDSIEIPMRIFDQADNVRRCFEPLVNAFSKGPSKNGAGTVTPEDLPAAKSET